VLHSREWIAPIHRKARLVSARQWLLAHYCGAASIGLNTPPFLVESGRLSSDLNGVVDGDL
jgi:hypothetical protein